MQWFGLALILLLPAGCERHNGLDQIERIAITQDLSVVILRERWADPMWHIYYRVEAQSSRSKGTTHFLAACESLPHPGLVTAWVSNSGDEIIIVTTGEHPSLLAIHVLASGECLNWSSLVGMPIAYVKEIRERAAKYCPAGYEVLWMDMFLNMPVLDRVR